MTPSECVDHLLQGRSRTPSAPTGEGSAPANIALVKYWGKRDASLNLPQTGSLSISLGDRGAHTTLRPATHDQTILDGTPLHETDPFHRRAFAFLNLLRGERGVQLQLETHSTLPIAAGLASSAAGFAALVRAADALFGWHLDPVSLSILARMGSGSACRSLFHGFVEWSAGVRRDGLDSYASPLPHSFPDLCIGLRIHESGPKPISSRDAMNRTTQTSRLYKAWPEQVSADIPAMRKAILKQDFSALGQTAEANALAMHATLLGARPPICYWTPRTLETLAALRELRAQGREAYATIDAGPNVKILFMKPDLPALLEAFPDLEVIEPFLSPSPGPPGPSA